MDEPFLYQKIAETIRSQIMDGVFKPGDRLPPVRHLTEKWNCTTGTIQRAYKELSRAGIVVSRAGQGTHVTGKLHSTSDTPIKRAILVNRAEAFLLEILSAGYSPSEIEQAIQIALGRWKAVEQAPIEKPGNIIRFSGSHDLAVDWLASHLQDATPHFSLNVNFCGSLGGLIALAEKKIEMAGCHLWDRDSNTYNIPFIRRLLPGKRTAIIHLASRHLGLIFPPGNPKNITGLSDLSRPDIRFINRQNGSGTRVWLDASLQKLGLLPSQIQGYENEKLTHSDVSRVIAAGQADTGIGLESVACASGLGFHFLTLEQYDLIISAENLELPQFSSLVEILNKPATKSAIEALGGYETINTGQVEMVF